MMKVDGQLVAARTMESLLFSRNFSDGWRYVSLISSRGYAAQCVGVGSCESASMLCWRGMGAKKFDIDVNKMHYTEG